MFKIYWSKNKKLGKILKRNTEDGKKAKAKNTYFEMNWNDYSLWKKQDKLSGKDEMFY